MIDNHRVRLRALEPEDAEVLYQWENDYEVWPISNTILPFSRFDIEQYILGSDKDIFTMKQLRLMLVDSKESKKNLGLLDLFDFDPIHRRAGIGILIKKEFRGQGFGKAGLELLLSYCSQDLHLHQVYCNIHEYNNQSLNLFKGFGFEIVGMKKEWVLVNNSWTNEYFLQKIF